MSSHYERLTTGDAIIVRLRTGTPALHGSVPWIDGVVASIGFVPFGPDLDEPAIRLVSGETILWGEIAILVNLTNGSRIYGRDAAE